ncbi:MAG: hypothetical protein Q7K42_05760 [Candidatus Diapherotrites archaeon]|nr:hypothetical protein [Candidatus Diapherotrites archaeon]
MPEPRRPEQPKRDRKTTEVIPLKKPQLPFLEPPQTVAKNILQRWLTGISFNPELKEFSNSIGSEKRKKGVDTIVRVREAKGREASFHEKIQIEKRRILNLMREVTNGAKPFSELNEKILENLKEFAPLTNEYDKHADLLQFVKELIQMHQERNTLNAMLELIKRATSK